MPVEVKFCGLTRPHDAAFAAALGAEYVGVVFAESPRRLSAISARAVYAGAPAARPVGVFGAIDPLQLAEVARASGLAVAQLHAAANAADVDRVRRVFDGEIWAVLAVRDGVLPPESASLIRAADAVLIDTHGGRRLGGTGVSFDWERVAPALEPLRAGVRVIVAGGLRPENVADAVRALAPDVVDVSSGVEQSAGIKDHARMRAFVAALGRHVGV